MKRKFDGHIKAPATMSTQRSEDAEAKKALFESAKLQKCLGNAVVRCFGQENS